MSKQTRYVVVVDLYVWASSDEEAKAQAAAIAEKLQESEDNSASVIEIYEQPAGTGDHRNVVL